MLKKLESWKVEKPKGRSVNFPTLQLFNPPTLNGALNIR